MILDQELNLISLTQKELLEIEGGIIFGLLVVCYAAGLAIGLMIV